jgi:hypothetical protein
MPFGKTNSLPPAVNTLIAVLAPQSLGNEPADDESGD